MTRTYTFSNTVVSNDVAVILNDDNLNERDEQFSLLATSLSSGVAIASGADTANITIIDNDCKKVMECCAIVWPCTLEANQVII